MASEISQISDSSIVIIQGTVALYTVTTRCHTYFAVTLKYTEDSSLIVSTTLFGQTQKHADVMCEQGFEC